MNFSQKVVIVTGASTGIGEATAKKLLSFGAKVYNFDIVESNEENITFINCNVSDYSQIKNAVEEVMKRENKIDLLFANAGIHLFANIEETSIEEFEKVLDVNIKGVYYILKEVIPVMKEQNEGKILLMGSDQSFVGKGKSSVYGLTKGAIAQLTKSTAIDYAPYNIKVNCICPGTIDTPLLDKAVDRFKSLTGMQNDEVMKLLEEAQPIQRIAKPEEIANMACYLLSDENSFMTGSLVPVDGGYTCQ